MINNNEKLITTITGKTGSLNIKLNFARQLALLSLGPFVKKPKREKYKVIKKAKEAT